MSNIKQSLDEFEKLSFIDELSKSKTTEIFIQNLVNNKEFNIIYKELRDSYKYSVSDRLLENLSNTHTKKLSKKEDIISSIYILFLYKIDLKYARRFADYIYNYGRYFKWGRRVSRLIKNENTEDAKKLLDMVSNFKEIEEIEEIIEEKTQCYG